MRSKMSLKEWLPLFGITVSAFIFNTSEFMPIGLLTDIADSFHITEAHAGVLITVYSWIVMLLSLPLMLLLNKIDFKRLLLGTIALFGIFQMLSAFSASYGMLMVSRIGVACTHSVFWSIASPAAVSVVSEKFRSLALSILNRSYRRWQVFLLTGLRQHLLYSGQQVFWEVFYFLITMTRINIFL